MFYNDKPVMRNCIRSILNKKQSLNTLHYNDRPLDGAVSTRGIITFITLQLINKNFSDLL